MQKSFERKSKVEAHALIVSCESFMHVYTVRIQEMWTLLLTFNTTPQRVILECKYYEWLLQNTMKVLRIIASK